MNTISLHKVSGPLKNLRKSKQVTQYELAEALGMSQKSISCYELGNRFPSSRHLVALADFFEVSVDYLLGRGPIGKLPKTEYNVIPVYDQHMNFLEYAETRSSLVPSRHLYIKSAINPLTRNSDLILVKKMNAFNGDGVYLTDETDTTCFREIIKKNEGYLIMTSLSDIVFQTDLKDIQIIGKALESITQF